MVLPSIMRGGSCDMAEPTIISAAGTVMLPTIVSGWLTIFGTLSMPSATMSMAR